MSVGIDCVEVREPTFVTPVMVVRRERYRAGVARWIYLFIGQRVVLHGGSVKELGPIHPWKQEVVAPLRLKGKSTKKLRRTSQCVADLQKNVCSSNRRFKTILLILYTFPISIYVDLEAFDNK